MSNEVIRGAYTFQDGQFIPDEGMDLIEQKLSTLNHLDDAGEGRPVFFRDSGEGSFWELRKFEDLHQELRQVTREYILQRYPLVNPDRAIG